MIQQRPCVFDGKWGRSGKLRYLLYLPDEYGADPRRRWPVILFLHGAGERGTDLSQVKNHGVARIVEEKKGFPFIAISPQCPPRSFWYSHPATLMALTDHVIETHAVDRRRIYLTGLSMGGYGAWHLAARYPDRFAAVVPICGGGLPSHGFPEKVCALKDVPVWAFHGAEDDMVPLSESKVLVDRLRACGGKVELTVYEGVGHDSWTRTYANPRVFEWLLEHTLEER